MTSDYKGLYPTTEVIWSPEPLDSLLPSVVAFQKMAEQCQHSVDQCQCYSVTFKVSFDRMNQTEALALKQFAQEEPTPQESPTHFERAFSQDSTLSKKSTFSERKLLFESQGRHLVSHIPIIAVKDKQLVALGAVNFLMKKRMYAPCVMVLIVIIVTTFVANPGVEMVEVVEDVNSPPVTFEKPASVMLNAWSILTTALSVLVSHSVSVEMLQISLRSFDAWFIFVNFVVQEGINTYNVILLDSTGREADVMWTVSLIVQKLTSFIGLFFVTNVDAIIISRLWKVLWYTSFLVLTSATYAKYRFFTDSGWTSNEFCWLYGCTTAKNIFLMASANVIVFVAKSLLKFAIGREYAFLSTHFDECETEEDALERIRVLSAEAGVDMSSTFRESARESTQEQISTLSGVGNQSQIAHVIHEDVTIPNREIAKSSHVPVCDGEGSSIADLGVAQACTIAIGKGLGGRFNL